MLHDGDLVEFHFHGTLDDGTVFDSSRGRRARVFVMGRGQLLPAFEAQLRTMSPGERRSFRLDALEAYGLPDPAAVTRVSLGEAPEGARAGDEVQLTDGRPARVVEVTAEAVTVDANHPLAGRALRFEVDLLAVTPAPAPPAESP